ncbi:dTDP-4-dehydrorhamnose reductase [Dysgonomonas capnocytophagoides]|uniref:dTDP-4-dehydrorhamnose reductase n=1 Tax=Dysgonomonas capnocytophagoides TaxID=45254 RepID=A0A4Y8KYA1_9BACT|nr:dTDP-4-dehydrorhamnose reductase [Dysgonomonas capnocytophagoides]TFD93185.1 dTDP-4-dehydrorhamnose reductase [Dysgonomonas capnocytophagoides]
MNILITGANGQLGNEMRLLSKESNKDSYFFTDVAELDITSLLDIRAFVKQKNIDVIVNCAAYTNVDKAEDDVELCDLINNKAVENLAIVAKEYDCTLIHVSTDYVFSGKGNLPCTEEQATSPLGVYGKTKLAGEDAIRRIGCKYLIFRTAWLYSEFGNNFVKTMIRLTTEKDSLKVVFDQVGSPTYAGDLGKLIFSLIEKRQYEQHQGIYHFSNEGVCSWYDFAKEISFIAGTDCDIQPCHSDEFPSKVTRPAFSVLDKTKVKRDFQFEVPYWKVSLTKCINKLKNN